MLIIGIALLNSNSGSSWGGGWYSNIKKQQEQNQQIGGICLGIGNSNFYSRCNLL